MLHSIYLSSPTQTIYHSYACGIEDDEDNTFIITGGWVGSSTNRVTKYTQTGQFTDLPTLNTARNHHGCGSYTNSNNQKVLMIFVEMNYCNFIILGVSGGGRSWFI